ncbi:MAG TPA: M14 family zinc carboxypeptidase, partial [Anaerolineaceae bacterium]|nr:M14 family zinc carboxypeptidase [Anaerolineaceae bacterium]
MFKQPPVQKLTVVVETPHILPSPAFVPTATATSTPEPSPTIQPTPTRHFGESFTIGYSVEGRPLEVYQFGNGPKERLIVAGIHGGYEWNTVALAEEMIAYLLENPDLISPEVTLYILKNMNPDGFAKAHDATGRANANGVDLNRNFDANWVID